MTRMLEYSKKSSIFQGRKQLNIQNMKTFIKRLTLLALCGGMVANCGFKKSNGMAEEKPVPGTDGDKYVPYEKRTGEEAVVYFTRSLSAEGLIAAYEKVNQDIEGKVGVKLHTGEPNGPNILPREWVKTLMEKDLKGARIIETNTYYEGGRYTTEQHRNTW